MMVDRTDFAILKCIDDAQSPLWKKKIHESLCERLEVLPIEEEVSVQTVGRRVDALHDGDLVKTAIISSDEIKRDLIIAFKLTEEGQQGLEERRHEFLRELVRGNLFPEDRTVDLEKPALVELIADEFGLGEETRRILREEYSEVELITFLTMYYSEQEAQEVFDPEHLDRFRPVVTGQEDVSNALEKPS